MHPLTFAQYYSVLRLHLPEPSVGLLLETPQMQVVFQKENLSGERKKHLEDNQNWSDYFLASPPYLFYFTTREQQK